MYLVYVAGNWDSLLVRFVVSTGVICGGIGSVVGGFVFLFRPGEPSSAKERTWDLFKFIGCAFVLLGDWQN